MSIFSWIYQNYPQILPLHEKVVIVTVLCIVIFIHFPQIRNQSSLFFAGGKIYMSLKGFLIFSGSIDKQHRAIMGYAIAEEENFYYNFIEECVV